MNDLISRQAAIDAFNTDIDELIVGGKGNAEAVEKYLNGVIGRIKELPSAQPEIIRCEDCVHWWESHKMCERNKDKNHNCACMDCDADFYCKNAERREDG